jgi:hypothetical protein
MTDAFLGDPLWARPVLSYTLASFASDGFQQQVARILSRIAEIAGGPDHLHLPPLPTLHASLYGIAPVRSNFDKEAYWQAHGPRALAELVEFCAGQRAFALRLRRLRATPTAVIAVAEPEEAVWALRRRMAEALPPPPGGAVRYDLIHVTLARYAQPEKLPADFAMRIAACTIDLSFPIETIVVMRETVYPSLAYDTVAAQSLMTAEFVS